MAAHPTDDGPRAAIPADIGAPDRIAFGLTFRQIALLGGVGLTGMLAYREFAALLPPVVWIVVGLPVAAVTVVVALGRRDGLPMDVWLRHAVVLTRTPRIQTSGAATSVAAMAGTDDPGVPAPLRTPTISVTPTGELTCHGAASAVVACGTTNIHLRTADEQEALIDGFGRWLNTLTAPAQIVVAAHRHDLSPYARAITDAAADLPDAALRAAAADYADFLADLGASRDPLRRQVLAVTGAQALDSTVRTLGGLGVTVSPLDGPAVTAALAAAVDPYAPPVAGPRAIPSRPLTFRRPS